MANNAFEFEHIAQIEQLARSLGGIAECLRLGFVYENEQGVIALSSAGLGFLVYVRARDITSVAEAFAAGYQTSAEENIDGTLLLT
jgi:hypothetical protein